MSPAATTGTGTGPLPTGVAADRRAEGTTPSTGVKAPAPLSFPPLGCGRGAVRSGGAGRNGLLRFLPWLPESGAGPSAGGRSVGRRPRAPRRTGPRVSRWQVLGASADVRSVPQWVGSRSLSGRSAVPVPCSARRQRGRLFRGFGPLRSSGVPEFSGGAFRGAVLDVLAVFRNSPRGRGDPGIRDPLRAPVAVLAGGRVLPCRAVCRGGWSGPSGVGTPSDLRIAGRLRRNGASCVRVVIPGVSVRSRGVPQLPFARGLMGPDAP